MAITHAAVKSKGEKGYAAEWNADHAIDDADKPKVPVTVIVAASDSIETTRADYVCDAADDQDTINEALAALGTTGGVVQLLEGTYQITAAIEIPAANIELRGLGYGTRIQTGSNISMVRINTRNHVAVRDLFIYGAGSGHASNIGVHFNTSDYCTVSGCYITNCGSNGIYTVTSMDYFQAYGNTVISNIGHGMRLVDVHEGLISGNLVVKNYYNGIYMQNGLNNVISGCNVSDNDYGNTATYSGINLAGSSWNTISGNRCHDNDKYEIDIWDAGCSKNLVHGNHARGGDHVGAINDSGTDTTLADNVTA